MYVGRRANIIQSLSSSACIVHRSVRTNKKVVELRIVINGEILKILKYRSVV